MTYASVDDVKARYLERDLRAITDENNQRVDDARVLSALLDASAEIDGYLTMRYRVPLVDDGTGAVLATPTVLVRACCDMAIYGLQTLRPREDIKDARQRYEDCIKMLKMMSTGDIQITGTRLKPGQAIGPVDAAFSPGMPEFHAGRVHAPFSRGNR